MAKYRITGPDGHQYEVTAPDDATQEQVLAYAQQNYRPQQPADFSGVTARTESTEQRVAPAANQSDFARLITGQPKQKPGWRRDLEMSARSVMQGAGGLLGAFGGDAANHYVINPALRAVGLESQQALPYRQEAAVLADRMGLEAPQTARERVQSDIGEALTGTGLTLGIGGLLNTGRSAASAAAPTVRSRLGDFLTAQPRLQTVSTVAGSGAAGVTRESGGSQGAQLAAGLIGGLAPGVASTTTVAGLRGLVRGTSGEQMQRNIDDFAKLGATPSVGQASRNRAVQGLESLLAGGPTSASVMNRFAEQQADNIGGGLQGIANSLSRNASGERAGRAIERGIELFGKNTGATKRALYWQADRFIPEQTQVGLPNTWQTIDKLTTPMQGATATTAALINPRIAQLRETLAQDLAAGGGRIPYSALKRIRSDIGEAISDFSLTPDAGTRELKQLYASLSRDMEAAAQAQGPAAVQAAKRANTYTRAVADRLEQVQRVIDKNGGPEAVYNAAMSGTRDGGTTLRAVMQSLPVDGQKAVTAAVIKRMGLATPGAQDAAGEAFSAATFLTNWNRVSPEARRALFDRFGPGFSRDIDRIASVADNIKQGSKVYANPSGTANRGAAQAYAIGLPLSLAQAPFTGHYWPVVATIGGGIGANVTARALTNPKVVNWLARSTSLPVGSINTSLREFSAQAQKAGDEDAMEFAQALMENDPNRAPRQSSKRN